MRALVLQNDGSLALEERPLPQPGADEVLVRIQAAALNRRDLWISKGLYPGLTPPVILGSDGVGIIEAPGPLAADWAPGARVLINPAFAWGDEARHQGPEFAILGNPRDGTFADYICVPATQLAAVPEHLDNAQAAALPLAGLTAYRALCTRGGLSPGERVVITGIGGGVAQLALMFARALGARVAVTSSSAAKREAALAAGAELAVDYNDSQWSKALSEWGGWDVAIDGNGGTGLPELLGAANFGARLVVYGATAGEPPGLPLRAVFWKQLSILGSTMGSPADFAAMLDLVARQKLCPTLDQVLPLSDYAQALGRMEAGDHCGKIVLQP